ncbi:MAG: DUF456 domain-containing protein [Planctomycetaceae bacterium]
MSYLPDLPDLSIDAGWIQLGFGILLVLAAIGCWFTNAFTLPGNWLIVGLAALFAWLLPAEEYGRGFGWITVIVLAVIAGLGELIEFAAGAAGAAKKGASRRAMLFSMVGAMIGSIAGAAIGFPIPIIGPLIAAVGGGAAGAFGGAYLGETWKGKQHPDRAAVSAGALMGRLFGTVGKLAAGAVMVAVLAVMTFMPADVETLPEAVDLEEASA